MRMIYVLSSRQKKELLVRGQALRICLPVPLEEITDPLRWAKSVLSEDVRDLVVSAEEVEIEVVPRVSASEKPDTLAKLIGKIDSEGGTTGKPPWTFVVVAIVATLRPRHLRGRGEPPMQWPLNVLLDGVPLLSGTQEVTDPAASRGKKKEHAMRKFDDIKTVVSGIGEVVISEGDGGYVLYSREEWETASQADYEADSDGKITRQGKPTAHRLTPEQMAASIA